MSCISDTIKTSILIFFFLFFFCMRWRGGGTQDCPKDATTGKNLTKQGIFQTYIAFDYRTLPPFAKIIESFISKILGALFSKKVPFLTNIKLCPEYLEHALQDYIVQNDFKAFVPELLKSIYIATKNRQKKIGALLNNASKTLAIFAKELHHPNKQLLVQSQQQKHYKKV